MPQPMPNAPPILPRYGQTATRARLAGFSLLVLMVACETTVAPIRRHDLAASRSGAGIFAVNCAASSLPGVLTIPELGTGSYFGQQGGLYPGGTNTMPAAHLALGLGLISQVQPRAANGTVDLVNGKIVQVSIGASTAQRIFPGDSAKAIGVYANAYVPLANADPQKNPKLVIVDGTQPARSLQGWINPLDTAWVILDQRLAAAGVTPAQVQVAWIMLAENRGPAVGFPGDQWTYRDSVELVVRKLKARYPNAQVAHLSPHYYQGYRLPTGPEPFTYEEGFGLKWVIEDQITGQRNVNADASIGPVVAPWLVWGPLLWGNGIIPTLDGLSLVCADFDTAGKHVVKSGVDKIGPQMLSFFKTDATAAPWFLRSDSGSVGDFVWYDVNGDGVQDAGEVGIAGVTVTLSGPGGPLTTTTDGTGNYLFTGLAAGNYSVAVATPAGFVPAPTHAPGSTSSNDSDGSPAAVTLATNRSVDLTIDVGFTQGTGVIGDFVWDDLDRNGIQDAGEPGLAAVTVTLSGATSITTTTDATGHYVFGNLVAGSYTVTVTTPGGYSASPAGQGADPLTDSNGSPASVTLATNGSTDTSVDFGYMRATAVAFDNATSASSGSALVTSLAWSHTVNPAGTNRLLLVSVALRIKTSQTVLSVKWGSTLLTRIKGVSQGTNVRAELWYLVNPSTGSQTITVATSGTATSVVAGASSYVNVHQVTPLGTAVSKILGSGTAVSVNVSSAVGQLVVDAVAKQNATESQVANSGQLQRFSVKTLRATVGDNVVGSSSDKLGATTVTMGWTSSAARPWAMVAVPLKPSP